MTNLWNMHRYRGAIHFLVASLAVMTLLAACGGGGSGGGSVSSTPQLTLLAGKPGEPGNTDGIGEGARFYDPSGIAADSVGNIYVSDWEDHSVRRITRDGAVTTVARDINYPLGIETDNIGNIYVAETSWWRRILRITPAGTVTTFVESTMSISPTDLAFDRGGNMYFSNPGYGGVPIIGVVTINTISKRTAAGDVLTFAGTAGVVGHADGTGAAASFSSPRGIAVDQADNIYVTDAANHTIRKITPAAAVSTIAGAAGVSGSADGDGAEARFLDPSGIATDSVGNVYVADRGNSTIRKITPAGRVSTVIGVPGTVGFVPGDLPGVITYPTAIAIRGATMYITTENAIVQVSPLP